MTTFLRLLADKEKATNLRASCNALRTGDIDTRMFQVEPDAFRAIPTTPFAYWLGEGILNIYSNTMTYGNERRVAKQGLATEDDFRFVRLWWEPSSDFSNWKLLAKGGSYSPYHLDLHLVINWENDGTPLKACVIQRHGNVGKRVYNEQYYFRSGITWSQRTTKDLSVRVLPQGCVFSCKGQAAFVDGADDQELLATLAIFNSAPFRYFVNVRVAAADAAARSYDNGILQSVPYPLIEATYERVLSSYSLEAYRMRILLDSVSETSHVFVLPDALRARLGDYDPPAIEAELVRIQAEIDAIAFDLYGFSEADRAAVHASQGAANEDDSEAGDDQDDEASDDEDCAAPIDHTAGLLSWAVGVAFGRFDWRLATSERAAPAEPEPFDPLPAKSPGMLPDGATPFHANEGVLVDDQGHPHDLARLIEEVLVRVEAPVPDDVRRWLQRDFFAFHLQRYSKSRRKAPIYWPLSTTSGSYTLWVYYPSLSSQALYTAINDFVEPKLKQVGVDVTALRNKGSNRTRDDEKQFETLQAFELELIELRDTLLKLAPTYKPNHDDGVQISAAPLWPLFRHKPWQKVLKDTWAKLEKGDYDWAHLAMNYWPERVREKCKTDKSLAIAHGLEDLYIEPEAKPQKKRGRKKGDTSE